jgi:Asp-tRNA(Asn)/Glu-tRNA(Gln) amidotransferase A subunit family amidase
VNYDPKTARFASYAEARRRFPTDDTPRAFLERCIEQVEEREPELQAFVALDPRSAREAADASTERWRRGVPLSPIDGLPVGIKDCFDVRGLHTRVNSAIYADNLATHDAAHVDALRRGGAIILGKTTTTELTMALPAPTRNPWDLGRTPGGSSSGSAAAVAAGMLSVATGSQVRGSVLRPASICGVIGFKPSYGAVNRHGGVELTQSLSHLGFLGGDLSDIWEAVQHIVATVGGDPGFTPLQGSSVLPPARKPTRLLRQYTAGWARTDEASQQCFEQWLRQLAALDIEILEPESAAHLAGYEDATTRVPEFLFDILAWELRWPLRPLNEQRPGCLSDGMLQHLRKAESMSVADYDRALKRRDHLRHLHRALGAGIDGFITLAHIGPGQRGLPPVGTPWYNDASSVIGAPSYSLPLLSIEGLPLGVQLMGFEGQDELLTSQARWLLNACGSACGGQKSVAQDEANRSRI